MYARRGLLKMQGKGESGVLSNHQVIIEEMLVKRMKDW